MRSLEGSRGSFAESGYAVKIAAGILSPRFTRDIEAQREVYKSFITVEELRLPANVEEDVLDSVMTLVSERGIPGMKVDYSRPYWNKDLKYNPYQMFGALIQYIDFHDEPLPVTVLPPEEDVEKYIDSVLSSPAQIRVNEQMKKLLDIADNNIVGAANLGFIASRLVARTYDSSAYPGIDISPSICIDWNKKIAPFEIYEEDKVVDGPGDTYYFWTHLFASLGYSLFDGKTSETMNLIFSRGTQAMRFVRENISRRPTLSRHEEASMIGRNLGFALADIVE